MSRYRLVAGKELEFLAFTWKFIPLHLNRHPKDTDTSLGKNEKLSACDYLYQSIKVGSR